MISILRGYAMPLPLFPSHQASIANQLDTEDLDWFFDSTEFHEWYGQQDSSILWLSGIPGSGKTVTALSLWSFLQSKDTYNKTTDVAVCFCPPSTGTRQTPETQVTGILSTLICRLTCENQDRIEAVTQDCELPEQRRQLIPSAVPATVIGLAKILSTAIKVKACNPIVIILDGIDMIQPEQERTKFLQYLLHLRQETMSTRINFKLCLTSRPFEDIKRELDGAQGVFVVERHKEEQRTSIPHTLSAA